MNGSSKAIGRLVAQLDNFLLILEFGDGADGAENFLLHDLHIGVDIAKDGGLDEVPLVTVALTTDLNGGALVLARFDVAHDAVVLELADLRTLEGVLGERISDLVLLSSLLEGLKELIIDALLDKDSTTGAAALSVVEVNAKVDP